ncbi:hypothetical protein TVAG_020010 [Trichomonas vaginalis G3]|uniref:Uncharacterized protein n=1 Tax=Trichomonas vaginalis (strain ATCC PRA-98 / G3) TaxID=412133 RepID=A2EPZ0_TRIV3|nr:hypothetical protein TVAGG3_0338430 [Trichomonas vaginalis G3]EAY05255.1 hypothetical protein TVAG_020010 [Trichomonas vaginalis G3]KAI5530450.1 hypothetical protein TVAGG3_0338430 [Trichomonas vaginalis G3]|eukprot:XP_001317478.1 hypothetical protein [Trichomonas vaginalis G3]
MISIGCLSNQFHLSQTIKHLFRGQGRLCILNAEKFTTSELKEILRPLLETGQPAEWKPCDFCPIYFYVKWSAYSVLAYFNIPSNFVPSEDFFLSLLDKSPFQWMNKLGEYLKLGITQKIPDLEVQGFLDILVMLYSYLPGLYTAIQSTINRVLSKIPGPTLFSYLKLDLFILKSDINNDIIQYFPIEFLQQKYMKEFAPLLVLLKNPMDVMRLQSLAIYSEPYPRKSTLFEQNRIFSLINQVIRKNKMGNTTHFLDEIITYSIRELIAGNYEVSHDIANDLPLFYPYIVLASYQTQPDQQKFVKILVSVMKTTKHKVLTSVYDAMNNDQNLLSLLYKITGNKVTLKTFETKSVPFILYPMMDSLSVAQLKSIFGKSLFNISDSDRMKDSSFMYAYFALIEVMGIIIGRKKSNKLTYYLEMIEDDEVMDAVIIDIMSLIFLQVGTQYICDVEKAELILSSITGFLNNPVLFNSANMKLTYARVRGFQDLKSCLVHPQTVILSLLKNSESDIAPALQLCQGNKSTLDKIFLIKEIRELMKGKFVWQIEINNRDLLGIEYFLSFGDSILPLNSDDNDIKIVVERRKEFRNQEALDIIQTDSLASAIQFYDIGFFEGKVFPKYNLFSSFCSYIGLIKKLSGFSTNVGAQSIVDILNNSSNYSWEDITTLLGPNALEVALQFSRRILLDSVFFKLLKTNFPLVAIAIAVDRKQDSGMFVSQIIAKYTSNFKKVTIKAIPRNLSEVFEIIYYYEDNFMEIPNDILKICAEIAIKERSVKAMNLIWEKDETLFIGMNPLEYTTSEISRLHVFSYIRTVRAQKLGLTYFTPVETVVNTFIYFGDFVGLYEFSEDFRVNILNQLTMICKQNPEIVEKLRNSPIKLFRDLTKQFPQKESYSYYETLKQEFEKIIPNPSKVYEDLPKVIKLFKNIKRENLPPQNLTEYFVKRIVEQVSFLTVFSGGLEARANVMMQRCNRVLEKMRDITGESTIDKIITLSQFVSIFPFTKTAKKYDFHDFQAENKGYVFATICSEMNQRQLMLQFCALWRLDFCPFLFKRAIVCFRQSFIDEGVKELEMVKTVVFSNHAKISSVSTESKELIEQMIQILSGNLLFDMRDEVIKQDREWKGRRGELYEAIMDVFSNECLMYMTKHKNTCDIMQYTFKLLESIDTFPILNRWSTNLNSVTFSSKQMKSLCECLASFNENRRLIYLLSTLGEFETVFSQLEKVPQQKRMTMFRSTIVYPALANSNWNKLWRLVYKSLASRISFIEIFFQFLSKSNMTRTLYDIQMKLGLYEDAIKSAVEGYHLANKWSTCLQIVHCIKDGLKKRISSEQSEIAQKRNILSLENLSMMLTRTQVQESIVNYAMKNKLPFNPDLEIIRSRENAESTAVFLLNNHEYSLVFDVLSTGVQPTSVFKEFVRKLAKNGPIALNKYCLAMNIKDEALYETTVSNIMSAMSQLTTDRNSLRAFIDTCVKTERAKIGIFMQNRFLIDALNLMKKKRKEYILQIKMAKDMAEKVGDNAARDLALSMIK